ncbi:MAG: BTAD domain-containing putative transcriptional regulator [Actinophytocola sp.]|uniref:AfsR/SARP family transcriptional regulator n=1 Tax=Actinophytocola sp. TaxID=1872138 RepID=UPI003D6BFCDD
MRFRLLGALNVFDGKDWLDVGAAKWRSLLAVLLVRAPDVVSMDQLVLELWGDRPPRTATAQVYGYVLRLRRLLGDHDGRLLRTLAPGYQLAVGPADVDAHLFGAQLERGHEALRAGRGNAGDVLAQALALWRGPALVDVAPTPLISAEASRLEELRLVAWEARVDADLARGRHATLIGELRRHVDEHPLRERPWGQLMLALHRGGRQAEALRTFQRVRRILVEEVGAEPGAELRRIQQRLLSGDLPDEVEVHARPAAPLCQLPSDVPDFTGREPQLRQLLTRLPDRAEHGPPPVVVVRGGPGVGKSTLVVHAAHQVTSRFPDGQLYLDLAGTSDEPREPAVLLAELLHALGVTGAGVPDGVPARTTLFRSLLAGRQVLLVLDDAANSEQVRPLLPSTGGCAVLVTSRGLLTDLPGAQHLELDVLAEAEAHRLLAGIIGTDRVAAEPDEARAILRACAHLPLAIRVAAGKLLGRPAWPLRLLRQRLADESRRLNELRLGELGVRASFETSVCVLPEDALRGFRLLGLLGPRTVPGWVLGPLLGRRDADDVLDTLVDGNLLRQTGIDCAGSPRYRLHDLLRAFALEGARTIPEAERREAVRRLLDAWVALAAHAADRLPPSLFRVPSRASGLDKSTMDCLVPDPVRWFEAERDTLLGAVALAAEWRLDEAAWLLAATVAPFYDHRSHYDDWRRANELALGAVRAAGNLRGEAVLLHGLGQLNIYRDEFDAARLNLHRSLDLCQRVDDKRGAGLAIGGLATIDRVLGNHDDALGRVGQALDMVVAAGDERFEVQLRNALGSVLTALGRSAEALTSFEAALRMCRSLGDTHREAVVLREASVLYAGVGDPDRARDALRRALQIFEDLDDERCVAYTLLTYGRISGRDGRRAIAALERAAAIFARQGNRSEEAHCLLLVGDLREDRSGARGDLTRALGLWQAIGARDQADETEASLARLGLVGDC